MATKNTMSQHELSVRLGARQAEAEAYRKAKARGELGKVDERMSQHYHQYVHPVTIGDTIRFVVAQRVGSNYISPITMQARRWSAGCSQVSATTLRGIASDPCTYGPYRTRSAALARARIEYPEI
jgi:hypothetical protein